MVMQKSFDPNMGHSASIGEVMERPPSVATQRADVRLGGPADEQEVCRLLLLAHAENAVFPASNERVIYHVRRFLNPHRIPKEDIGPRGVFGVIGKVGELAGVCMLGIGQMWYADQRHVEEYVIFVDPNYRSGSLGYANALIQWAKLQAHQAQKKLLTGILSNHRTEAKVRLYRRVLPKVGEYFLYNPNDDPDFYADLLTGPGSLVLGSSAAA
jgi:hypothetical protein